MLIETPVEIYHIKSFPVFVKREDQAALPPAPPFSKLRGVVPHLIELKAQGYTTIGYTETSISMAGWGLAWAGKELGLKVVIFDPQYKETPAVLQFHRKRWKTFGAEIIPVKAGRAKVNYYIGKNILKKYPNSIMIKLGMPFDETIHYTFLEAQKCFKKIKPSSVIVNVGSGIICSGILKAADLSMTVFGIMGRSGSVSTKQKFIQNKSGTLLEGILKNRNLILKNPGWNYTDFSSTKCPFPCNPFYDLKAFEWMKKNIENLPQPILFWNIGK